jgi:hypothetical protein
MTKYTYTFNKENEGKFKEVLSRLDPDEYNIIEDIKLLDDTDPRYSDRQAIIEMDSEACLTFRMRLGTGIKIRRERTDEELAAEKELSDKNTVRITVLVPPSGAAPAV